MLENVRWGLLVVIAVAACGCGSGRARTPTQSEGSNASAPTKRKPRQPARVLAYCEVSGRSGATIVGNHPTDDIEVDVDVALEGAETETSDPDAATKRALGSAALSAGSKIPMRTLLNLTCSAQFPAGQPFNVALADRWFKQVGAVEYRVNYCKATTLDLSSLDAGKPYSVLLRPIVLDDWKIQNVSPDLSNIEIGSFDKRLGKIRVVGAHRCAGAGSDGLPRPCLPGQLDTGGAQVAWDYAEDDGPLGASRVDLAADCPTLEAQAKDAVGSDVTP